MTFINKFKRFFFSPDSIPYEDFTEWHNDTQKLYLSSLTYRSLIRCVSLVGLFWILMFPFCHMSDDIVYLVHPEVLATDRCLEKCYLDSLPKSHRAPCFQMCVTKTASTFPSLTQNDFE